MSHEALKRRAARAAVEAEVRSGMVVGLGSGSTAAFAVAAIAEALDGGRLERVVGIPTSVETEQLARARGIPLIDLHQTDEIAVTIDGADEIDPSLDLIKGLGGALLREKMVAQASRRLAIVADQSKRVDRLGTRSPLPVEVVRFGWKATRDYLAALGAVVGRRGRDGNPYISDNGNFIIDARWEAGIDDPAELAARLAARAGIVEHGLFLGMADVAYVAGSGTVERLVRDG